MKNILFFGSGYILGGLLVGYSITNLLERSLYDRNCRTNACSVN